MKKMTIGVTEIFLTQNASDIMKEIGVLKFLLDEERSPYPSPSDVELKRVWR